MPVDPATTWTIGHSTRTLEVFLGLLVEYRIEAIADVRRFPGSRRYPHFASEALAGSLPAHGIAYQWIPKLGGRRKVQPESPNTAWRNASFQGYADYTATTEFAEGLAELLKLAASKRTAMMCAEVLWWRCHRSIVSDVVKLRGIEVIHIIDATHTTVHPYTSPARIVDGRLSYAGAQGELL
ncbi:DUF488 domain-containing protein [Rhodanobacter sp. T12-5]|uniref:DUF488 domain-containing protein n=1 Tax=Rhodanobacter sp. T12-5 TaxID=2024611 RepID=UPI0011EE7E3D|nr:DUF488 domain-containing protein [Rhodanobacter sp. T12-5]KAA0069726.1 DUF488 domain-containing protein [Rhodanobacter sp. T12-5]